MFVTNSGKPQKMQVSVYETLSKQKGRLQIHSFTQSQEGFPSLLPLDKLFEKTVRSVLQDLFVFCDGVRVVSKFLLQFLKLFELLTNLLQAFSNNGEPTIRQSCYF